MLRSVCLDQEKELASHFVLLGFLVFTCLDLDLDIKIFIEATIVSM